MHCVRSRRIAIIAIRRERFYVAVNIGAAAGGFELSILEGEEKRAVSYRGTGIFNLLVKHIVGGRECNFLHPSEYIDGMSISLRPYL